MTSAIITAVIGLLCVIACIFVLSRYCGLIFTGPSEWKKLKNQGIALLIAEGLAGIGGLLLVLAIFLNNPSWSSKTEYGATELFAGKAISYPYQMTIGLIGGFLFAISLVALIVTCLIHFRKKNMEKYFKKKNLIILFSSIVALLIGFLGWTEAVAPYLTYPLYNGFTINFTGESFWTWTSVAHTTSGGLHVAFYGIVILCGVGVCYVICSYQFYKEYHKKGLLDTTAIAGFIGGILGARIWYVVGNYSREFASQVAAGDVGSIFRIWDGGLTILGGAIAGVICGYLWLKMFVKVANPRFAIDICVPTILLAQALGRWGNFFNCEVYGQVVSVDGFSWLPSWLLNQMHVNNNGTLLDSGYINVPLFLIEGIFNIIGYFLIVYGTRLLKNKIVLGDRCGLYFAWYGLVRVIMEPMRNTTFNMGTDNSWSICNSIAYIFIGLGFVAALHTYEFIMKHPEKKWVAPCIAAGLSFIGLFMPFIVSVNGVITNTAVEPYSGFEIMFSGMSPLYLVIYILLILTLVWLVVYAVLLRKNDEKMKTFYNVSFYGTLALLAALTLLFILSTPSITFSKTYDDVNVSYGFVLAGLWCASGAAILVSLLIANKSLQKKEAVPEVVEEAK